MYACRAIIDEGTTRTRGTYAYRGGRPPRPLVKPRVSAVERPHNLCTIDDSPLLMRFHFDRRDRLVSTSGPRLKTSDGPPSFAHEVTGGPQKLLIFRNLALGSSGFSRETRRTRGVLARGAHARTPTANRLSIHATDSNQTKVSIFFSFYPLGRARLSRSIFLFLFLRRSAFGKPIRRLES